jgi:hypothetical protein
VPPLKGKQGKTPENPWEDGWARSRAHWRKEWHIQDLMEAEVDGYWVAVEERSSENVFCGTQAWHDRI